MSSVACPVCRLPIARIFDQRGDHLFFECQRCGRFSITGTAHAVLERRQRSPRHLASASGWVREQRGVEIGERDVDSLADIRAPSVAERAEKLLVELDRRARRTGARVSVTSDPEWLAITWSSEAREVEYLLFDYLRDERNSVDVVASHLNESQRLPAEVRITPKGYAQLDALTQVRGTTSIGFCAMWFDSALDGAWTEAIGPAIAAAGYDARRLDRHEHNNRIDDEVIANIRKSRFLVADLTGHRGGVYFEAGFALGLGLPVIWTVREGDADSIHFDNRQYNFIRWELSELDRFRSRLQNRIQATIGPGPLKH